MLPASFPSRRLVMALLLTAALVAAACYGPQPLHGAPAPPGYSIVELGPMEGLLNDAGEVAGNRDSNAPFPARRPAYFWKAGARVPRKLPRQLTRGLGSVVRMSRSQPTLILLDTSFRGDGPYYLWDGRSRVEAVTPWRVPTTLFDMNGVGDVVGALENGPGGAYYNTFVKKHGQTAQLIPSDSDHIAFAVTINDRGEMGGTEYDREGIGRAIYWDAQGARHPLGDPPGITGLQEVDVRKVTNHQPAELLGTGLWSDPGETLVHPVLFYWTVASGFQIPNPPLPPGFEALSADMDVNDQGLVTLTAYASKDLDLPSRAFTWDPVTDVYTELTPAGTDHCRAEAINNLGEIVLQVRSGSGPVHYQVWKNGSSVELGPIFPDGAALGYIGSINNRSQILAFALVHNAVRGYLLTPRASR